jgi:hypothetical protein
MPRPWFTTTDVAPLGESDRPAAAIVLGAAGALMASGVWIYLGYHLVKGTLDDHNIQSTIRILGAVGLLGGFPAVLAVILGALSLLQRRASRSYRRKSAIAMALGLVGLCGAVAIQVAANAAR